MNKLPFNQKTLTFYDKDFEQMYETYIDNFRVKSFKLESIFVSIVCLSFMIVFIIEQQNLVIIIMLSIAAVGTFNLYLISTKLKPYLRYFNCFMLIWSFSCSLLVAASGFKIRQMYLFGLLQAQISAPIARFCIFKARIVIVLLIPVGSLLALNVFHLEEFQYCVYAFLCSILVAYQEYSNEYMARTAFSYNTIAEKYKLLLNQYIADSFFGISFDQHSRQFILEFQNQESENQLNVKDTDTVKDLMRKIIVQSKQQQQMETAMIKSQEVYSKRLLSKQYLTLEELAFHKISTKDETEITIDGQYQKTVNDNSNLKVMIKHVFVGKPMLFITLKFERIPKLVEKYEQQIKFQDKFTKTIMIRIANKLTIIFNEIQRIHTLQESEKIKYYMLSLMNKMKNILVFINKGQITINKNQIKPCLLKDYLHELCKFLLISSHKFGKQFNIQNNCDEHLELVLEYNMLTQIIINFYELALQNADNTSAILMQIEIENDLDPINQQTEKCKLNLCNSIDQNFCFQEGQTLLKFSIVFFSSGFINLNQIDSLLINPQTCQDFIFNNSNEIKFTNTVTKHMLSYFGPYNFQKSSSIPSIQLQHKSLFINRIWFYVYKDQSQIPISYMKSYLNANENK